MDQVEIVRVALAEVGDLPADELAAFAQARFGVKLNPLIVPVLKATLRDRERLAASRTAREAAVRAAQAASQESGSDTAGEKTPGPLPAERIEGT